MQRGCLILRVGRKIKKQGDGDGLMYDKMGYTAEYMVHKLFERDFGWDFCRGEK